MSWVSSSIHWLAAMDANKATVLATVVSAIGSVVVAGATYWLGKLTRSLATETRLTRESGERADVQCAVEPHAEHIVILELIITNLGRASAEDVEVCIQSGGHLPYENRRKMQLARLLPGSVVRTSLGSFPMMSEEEKRLKVWVAFRDKLGVHESAYRQDLNGLLGLIRVGNSPGYQVANHLDKVSRTLEQIEKRLHKLPVDLHGRKEREQELVIKTKRDRSLAGEINEI